MSDASVTAVVLCGGLGTRLRPAVGDLPKALAPVAGQPFITFVLRYIADEGVTDIVLCTGYKSEDIAAFCSDGSRWGTRLRFSVEREALGTGGAIRNAQSMIQSSPFFVLNGDSFIRADLQAVRDAHAARAAKITMVLCKVEDQARFGSVNIDAEGAVLGFAEKSASGRGLINAGIYLMDASVIDAIPSGFVSLEKEILPRYVGDGLIGVVSESAFIDIGTPESLRAAPDVLPKEWQEWRG